jgi:hypothetical protein
VPEVRGDDGARHKLPGKARRRDDIGKFGPIKNQGKLVERAPLNEWEAYSQALLFTNELAYFN